MWYQRDFTFHPKPHTHVFLHFGAANYAAHIFVNDMRVCDHEGGFTPFDCEITNVVKNGDNFIVAAIENRRAANRIPALKFDWWDYGGLTREVSLVEIPESYIDDYTLQLKRDFANQIDGYVHLIGAAAGTRVTLRIPQLHLEKAAVTDTDGRAEFSFTAPGLELWSPDHPRLYAIELNAGSDELKDDIGFRTIQVKSDQVLLNGKPIFLRGVSIHEEAPYRSGRAWSEQDSATLLGWAHELHCNFVRLVHYPHVENETRLADKPGIMVWSEIPVWVAIDWTDPHALEIAKQQLGEMIRRDRNKASVILWSISNETPDSPARNVFLHQLAVQARQQDPTRLITSAIVAHFKGNTAPLDDPLGLDLDVLGYNEYLGWYTGTPATIPNYTWKNPQHKPLIFSEFGAGAKPGLHGSVDLRFAEEYQENVYRQQFLMFWNIPFLRGVVPWVLMDFRSPNRQLPDYQDGYNRKDVISDQGEKKKAFFTLQDHYAQIQK
jgi:beta-glucuronidase